MIDGIQFKVCGLTSLVDAEFADRLGADYLGFILYPKSPRHVSLPQYVDMAKRLPTLRKTVAVLVEPRTDDLDAAEQELARGVTGHLRTSAKAMHSTPRMAVRTM